MLVSMAAMIPDYLPGQGPPREHPWWQVARDDWIGIRTDIVRLEYDVKQLRKQVHRYNSCKHLFPAWRHAEVLEELRQTITLPKLYELIQLARSIREHYSELEAMLLDVVQQDWWAQLLLNRMADFEAINRTMHVEKHWIRVVIARLPFDLGIDYHTLAVL